MIEVHVTIEPILDDEALMPIKRIAALFGFRVADLLMVKRPQDTPERSKYDTFMTGHFDTIGQAKAATEGLIRSIKLAGVKVWRYKLERIVVDSRDKDVWELLA